MRLLALLTLSIAGTASAQVGPGLGNLTYSPQELFSPISFIESPQGHGNVAMVQGYLMVIFSSDGGGNAQNGGIEFWNVADPRAPVLAVRYDDLDTHGLREAHGFSLAWYDARLLLAAQGEGGIQIWDVTDPHAISLVAYLDLIGIEPGDYSGDWWLFWQAPYLYVAGVDSGLYVVDATNPAQPVVASQVPTGDLGGVSPAQVFALGNLAVVMESQGSALATLDISTPDRPRLLRQVAGRAGYSHLFAGDGKILTSGNIPPRAHFLQVTPDGDVTYLSTVGFFFDSGGYGSYQDGFFHSGFSDNYVKFAIDPPQEIGNGSSGRGDRDEDFAAVLGNVVFAGDDHGVGTALIPHQTAPDLTPPQAVWMHPPSGSTGVALTSRIGLSFSDQIDAASLGDSTLWLEDDGGNAIPVRRSAQMGLVNLTPLVELGLLRTYRVIAEGVRDVAGNVSPRFEGTITTGDGSIPLSPTAAITNVDVTGFGDYALGLFAAGKKVYSDRDYTFTPQFPPRFDGQAYLLTANIDRNNFLSGFLDFQLLAPAEVLVLFDSRATSIPNWLSSFTPTGETVLTTDATLDVYSSMFSAGPVTLGGNGAAGSQGAESMYSVVIIPEPVPCAIDLTPIETGTVTLSGTGPQSGSYEWRVRGRVLSGAGPTVYLPPGRHPITLTVASGVLGATCGGVKIAHRPLVAEPARTAGRLLFHSGHTINGNADQGTVTRADPSSGGSIVWETSIGGRPETLATRGDELWVVEGESARIAVLDLDGREKRSIALPRASAPFALVFAPNGTPYVTLSATGEVIALAEDGSIARRASVPHARGLTWFDDRLYAPRFISPDERGEIYVLDAATLDQLQIIALAFDPGPDTEGTGRGLPNYLAEVQISPDGSTGFVASKKDNIARGLYRDGLPLTFESRVRTIVSAFDVATGAEDLRARLDVNDRDLILTTLSSPYADLLFAASQGGNTVEVFDVARRERVSQFEVGLAPQGLALDASNGRLAVYNFLSRSVRFYDVSGLLGATSNAAVEELEISTIATETLTAEVLAGKRIFHDASDDRMSRDGYISCASCHLDGGHDGRTWDFTQAGEGLRNTIPLWGRAGTQHGNVHWTANFDELQDFENDIRDAFGGTGFLSDADFAATRDPLGMPKAGRSMDLDALAAFVATLDRYPPSPHRSEDGTLTLSARRGREVFLASGCASCHSGAAFSDLIRHDVGTATTGSGLGIGRPLEGVGFETPTLRSVFESAPYLHDGSAATLSAALDRHGEAPASGPSRDDLLRYLLELDGSSLPPEADCDAGPNECVDFEMPPVDGGTSTGMDASDPIKPPADAGSADAQEMMTNDPEPAGCGCRANRGGGSAWGLLLLPLLSLILILRSSQRPMPKPIG